MKKASLLTTLFVLLLLLTACGSGNASTNGSGGGGSSANGFGGGGSSGNGFRSGRSTPLSPEAKLALGTMKLEGTRQAVDANMAAKLIPLWQLLVQLNSSSSSAPQEVAAVVDQIKTTMTPDQLNTVNSMTLTQADIFTAFQGQTQTNGSGGTTDPGGQSPAQGSSRGNRGNGGGFVFGGGPGGGFGGGGFGGGCFGGGGARTNGGAGSNTGSQTSSSLTAAEAAQARQNAISSLLANQLIRLLQTKLRS